MIWGDYHTHTRCSDGKGTVLETLQAADAIGLKQVGISDHGLRHLAGGIHFRDILRTREQIEKYQPQFKVKCLMSIEANIYSSYGDIDLKPEHYKLFDYVIAGYHKAAWAINPSDFFRYNLPAFFADWRKSYTDAQRRKYTKTIVSAIKSNKFNILSHLNYGIPTFVAEVGKAAVDYNVFIELNGKRVNMTDDEILQLQDLGVNFIINSDGHSPQRIGEVSVPMAVVDRLNLNKDQIANWEKLPDLRTKI